MKEYEGGGVKPKRASGTRWISHKMEAMKICLDKWGLYINHLENISKDAKCKPEERAKMIGYLRKWKKARIPVLLALFIDLLEIPSILSKCFQDDQIDTVNSSLFLAKAKKRLQLFKNKTFEKLPHVKHFLDRCERIDDKVFYQDVELVGFNDALESAKVTKELMVEKVVSCVSVRLEIEKDSECVFKQVTQILNTEGWSRSDEDGEDDTEFADEDIISLKQRFQNPLLAAGVSASDADFLDQWHSLIEYAKEFLSVSSTPYRVCWRRIFQSPRRSNWKDVLILIRLLFTIPISNAKLERMFSKMKQVKVIHRCSLSEGRLENILRIVEDGPSITNFNLIDAVNLWLSGKDRRSNQQPRKVYNERSRKRNNFGSLGDSDDTSDSDDTRDTDDDV